MTLRDYFKNQFQYDFLKMLNSEGYRFPSGREFCFGGQQWEKYEKDISAIAPEHIRPFIKSLFLSQLVQACVHCYYPTLFEKYYKTMPFFGCYGFGTHHIKMKTLLEVPAQHGVIFSDAEFAEMAQDFFDQCLVDCEQLDINYMEFMSKIHDDIELRHIRQDKDLTGQEQFAKFVIEFDKIYQESLEK